MNIMMKERGEEMVERKAIKGSVLGHVMVIERLRFFS